MRSDSTLSFQAHPPKGSLPAIVYALAAALLPVITSIADDHTRPWTPRTRTITRFNRILQQFLALVAHMHPKKLGQAAFTRLRPAPNPVPASAPEPTTPETPNHPKTPTRPRKPRNLARTLSARQVAANVATLLRQLQALAQETGVHLPANVRKLCARLRAKAGCDALPPTTRKPTRGFFAELMTLPPGHPLLL